MPFFIIKKRRHSYKNNTYNGNLVHLNKAVFNFFLKIYTSNKKSGRRHGNDVYYIPQPKKKASKNINLTQERKNINLPQERKNINLTQDFF